MKKNLILIMLSFTTLAIHAQQKSGAQQFWNLLKQHCGKAYQGEITQGLQTILRMAH